MAVPPPDAAVRLRLKCPDADDFVTRFAPNVTRGGVFLPTHHARAVGAPIRFEIALLDGAVVFAGAGVVTWVKPKGMGVKFTTLDRASEWMLERLIARREAPAATARESAAAAPANPAPPIAAPAAAASAPAPTPPSETPPAPDPAPPVAPAMPPPAAPSPAAATAPPAASARAGSLRVDSILVSASYKDFTCPDPTRRISV